MAETLTPNYGWTKPDPGASANTWGATLNATTDKVDAQVFVNQTAITAGQAPIGSGALWFTNAPPANWLLCDGSSLSTAAPYDKLFAVIGYQFGGSGANFNLPPANGKFPVAAHGAYTLGATGGEVTHTLAYGEMPAHLHNVPDPQHYHTINQGSHTHGDYGHTHSANANQDAHAHAIPYDLVNPAGGGLTSGGGSYSLVGGAGTDNRQPAVHVSIGTGYASLAPSGTGITNTDYATTRISTTDSQGSGAPHNNMPPYLAVNFIIRYQ